MPGSLGQLCLFPPSPCGVPCPGGVQWQEPKSTWGRAVEGVPIVQKPLPPGRDSEVNTAIGKALEELQFHVTTELTRLKDLLDVGRFPLPAGDTAVPDPDLLQRPSEEHPMTMTVLKSFMTHGFASESEGGETQWTSESSRQQQVQAQQSRLEEKKSMRRSRTAMGTAHPLRKRVVHFVQGEAFDVIWIVAVVLNAIQIGVQTQWAATHLKQEEPLVFMVCRYFFTLLFTVELALRITSFGCRELYTGRARWWAYLDTFVVATSIFEAVCDALIPIVAPTGAGSNLRTVRMVKLARVLRGLRIERLMHMVSGLRTLVVSIAATLKSLMWAMLLLVIIMYIVGITLTEFVVDFLAHEDLDGAVVQQLQYYWRSLDVSMFTLFQSISGGLSWRSAVEPLESVSLVLSWVFTSYIGFTYFAVLNVVTGVFCNSAIESAQHTPEVVGQTMLTTRKAYIALLEKLFVKVDVDQTNDISFNEFEQIIIDPDNRAFLSALEIEAADAWTLFKLIDLDKDGTIEKDEFIQGCLQLKGMARNVELQNLHHDVIRLEKKLKRYMVKFAELRDILTRTFGALGPPSGPNSGHIHNSEMAAEAAEAEG